MRPDNFPSVSFQIAIVFALCTSASIASAQTGGADDCANAQVFTGATLTTIDTTTATLGSVQPTCATIAKDVWFRWTPSVSGLAQLNTCYFGTGDSVIAVYAGAGCPTSPPIACDDDACMPRSQVIFPATAGTTYMFQIGAKGATNVTGQLYFTFNTLTPNDECAYPTAITGTGTFSTTTLGATAGFPVSGCNPALADVWYSWIAPLSGVAVMDSCGGTTADSILSAWGGTDCSTAPLLACSDDYCGGQSHMSWAATAGSSYLLQVGQYTSTAYVGTFQLDVLTPAANDSCSTPYVIMGPGPHPFDLTLATTGMEGQNESTCFTAGHLAMPQDVWFLWTATTTGRTSVSTCDSIPADLDTKIVIYPGSGCPATLSSIGCNDNSSCGTYGTLSNACFDAVAGSSYLIQIAANVAGTPTGTFTVIESGGSGTNDDCSTPLVITGVGPHPFDTTTATSGCAGQGNPICGGSPFDVITHDRWFAWTAPSTGDYEVTTCGQAGGASTKIGVYLGLGCPAPASAVACSRLSYCGSGSLESRVCFVAQAGMDYSIQIGAGGGQPGAVGAFTIQPKAPLPGCRYDDGTSETAYGLYEQSGGVLWMHRFGAPGMTTTVNSISTAFGSPAVTAAAPGNGSACVVAIWSDPNGDGNPSDAVLLQSVSGVVLNSHTDILTTYTLGHPETVSGYYFVGAALPTAGGTLPAPIDLSSCLPADFDRAWFSYNLGATINLVHVAQNSYPPAAIGGAAWLLRADCTTNGGTPVCAGDGSGAACPCGNASAVLGTGCKNSFSDTLYSGSGASVQLDGEPSLSNDQVRLRASALPMTASCLMFQGTTANPAVFGDGLRCAGGSVRRLVTRTASSGIVQYGFGVAGDPPVHLQGAINSPGIRVYQVWYRNIAAFCTPAGFNLTNGLSVLWSA